MADYVPGTLSQIGAQTGDAMRGVDRMRTMAELAARQFEAIPSPNANFWAAQLRQDPRAAFKMAQQYGGLQNVEAALKGAYGRGEAVRRGAVNAVDAPLFEHAPQDYTRLAQGRYQAAAGAYDLAQATQMAMLQDMSLQDTMQYWQRVDPSKAKALRESTRNFSEESMRAKLSERKPASQAASVLLQSRNNLDTMAQQGFDKPDFEYAMAVVLNKILQPNSAVLLGEAEAVSKPLMSMLGSAFQKVGNVWEPVGLLDEAARKRLWEMARDLADEGLRNFRKKQYAWRDLNQRLEFDEQWDLFTRPGVELMPWIDEIVGAERMTVVDPDDASREIVVERNPETGKWVEILEP